MDPLSFVRVVALVCLGLFTGVLVGDWMGASAARPALDPGSFVTFQQIVHVTFVRMMPLLMGSSILGGVIWLVLIRSRPSSAEFVLVALATAGVVFIFALTRIVNVPINDALMTWTSAAPPNDLDAQWAPWELAHTVRTFVALVAFVLETVALSLVGRTQAQPHA